MSVARLKLVDKTIDVDHPCFELFDDGVELGAGIGVAEVGDNHAVLLRRPFRGSFAGCCHD